MTELTNLPWAYYLRFTPEENKDYVGYYEPNNTDYLPSVDKIYIQATGRWGGGFVNTTWTQFTALSKKIDNFKEYLDSRLNKLDEKKEDLSEIISKIDSIKFPEIEVPVFEEKEAKKVAKLVNTLDKKLSGYIDTVNQSKEELSEIANEFTKLEMEEKKKEIEHERMKKEKEEKEKKMEEEQDKILLEEIKKEFDKMEEEDRIEKKKELENEIKEKEKEIKEMKKELNSIN